MKTAEIRNAFLEYFAKHDHQLVASSPLVPAGDPTLLFTNAGMVQFKDVFLGTDNRPYRRATTCQKSLRISGKHNDLENVGRTARHHTFFEMLGNFSFGDYFKQHAIKFAWTFLTEELRLSKDRLWVTIFEDDDEAEVLWKQETDVDPAKILRCGKEDNFWAMGDTGPCGPCSEIHYFLGSDVTNQSEADFRKGDGTYIEIWNLVFMQFNRDTKGTLVPLPRPSVDTGMGLERVAGVKQGKLANYDTDEFQRLISKTAGMCGKKYIGASYEECDTRDNPQYAVDVALRVIADHARAASFLIADGILPSGDGRGYVLRRLIRRACRHGRVLGFHEPFLFEVSKEVIAMMGGLYPELASSKALIEKVIRGEEEKFLQTLDIGLGMLGEQVTQLKKASSKILPGTVAFQLHDTFGFPLDLTQDILRADGISVDEEGFSTEMEQQRERSRSARASETELVLQRSVTPSPTKFVGYDQLEWESEIAGIFDATGELRVAKAGSEVAIVVRETPFFGESGGQLGDSGRISSNTSALDVIDTRKVGNETVVHICRVVEGEVKKGTLVRLAVDANRRNRLRAHHSATHLVHLALREVLGDHVKQAGSRVSDASLRFDFSQPDPITDAQLKEVELMVNTLIMENHPVVTEVLALEDAKRSGAMALFGEKYGEHVRVVQIGPRSKELCGGTHVARSGDIGPFMIVSTSGISAGVRRVEAVAGLAAYQRFAQDHMLLAQLSGALKVPVAELGTKVAQLLDRNKTMEREHQRSQSAANSQRSGDMSSEAQALKDGVKFVSKRIDDASQKQLRELADDLRSRLGTACIVLASVHEGKPVYVTAITDNIAGKGSYHAGQLMKEITTISGSQGGGRADLAQAGGGDPDKVNLALERVQQVLL